LGRNAEFIDELIKDPVFSDMLQSSEGFENGHTHTHSHGNGSGNGGRPDRERDSAQEKVRSTLRSFVRDWSDLGLPERTACYTPCLEALERAFPVGGGRGGKRVLIPGCGLGRLAMEVAARGESHDRGRARCRRWRRVEEGHQLGGVPVDGPGHFRFEVMLMRQQVSRPKQTSTAHTC
jgi:hypothetical protein